MSTVQTSTDVILQDEARSGCARPEADDTPTRCSTSSGRSRSEASPPLPRLPESRAPPGRAAARARLGRARRAIGSLDVDGVERLVAATKKLRRLRDPTTAESAFAVADDFRAAASARLLEQLAARAAEHGIERFVAEVLADNRDMLGVFESAGFEVARALGRRGRGAFPDRRHRALPRAGRTARPRGGPRLAPRPFFEPRSVAVVGASCRRGSIGGELFRNILAADFLGAAYPSTARASPSRAMYSRTARSPTSPRTSISP